MRAIPFDRPDPETNVLDRAVCLTLSMGRFGNTRKVATALINVDADKARLAVSKRLLDSPELEAVQRFDLREGRLPARAHGAVAGRPEDHGLPDPSPCPGSPTPHLPAPRPGRQDLAGGHGGHHQDGRQIPSTLRDRFTTDAVKEAYAREALKLHARRNGWRLHEISPTEYEVTVSSGPP